MKQPNLELKKIQDSFNHINSVYRSWAEIEIQAQTASPAGAPLPVKTHSPPPVLIDQMDMHNNIFQKLDTENYLERLEWILVAYLNSLFYYAIPTIHNINELLVTTLVSN